MLRPATPLSVLLFAAFVLLLLSVVSIPVTKFISLGENKNVKYGVFGYCDGDKCSKMGLGYPSGGVLDDDSQQFDLPTSVRRSLSAILIIHPVAAFLTLVMLGLAVAAHKQSSSHSARYLLIVFVFMLFTFVVCLVAFVIDVLLFTPHLAWGSYLVLASAIILAVCAVATCVVRRSIISKKTREQRAAESAEMTGQSYFDQEAQLKPATVVATQPALPALGGAADSLPTFATFENHKKDDRVSDERVPLTQRSPLEGPIDMANMGGAANMADPRRSSLRNEHGYPHDDVPNAFGSPPMQPYGRGQGVGQRGGRGGPSGRGGFDTYGVAGRGPGRGRGGFGPPPGRGGPRGRGGYGPPPRGGPYGPGGMRGGRGPPPASYGNVGSGPYDRVPPSGAEYMPYGQPQSRNSVDRGWNGSNHGSAADGYDVPRAESPPPLPGHTMGHAMGVAQAESPPPLPGHAMGVPRAESPPPLPGHGMGVPRAESPPPLPGHAMGYAMGVAEAESPPPLPGHAMGVAQAESPPPLLGHAMGYAMGVAQAESPPPLPRHAIGISRAESPPPLPGHAMVNNTPPVELDAGHLASPDSFGRHKQLRDSDGDVAGMVGLQQQRAMVAGTRDTFMSDTSRYSTDEHYLPPQTPWNRNSRGQSPRTASSAHSYRPTPEQSTSSNMPYGRTGPRSDYYEDIDPKFEKMPPQTGHAGPMPQTPPPEPAFEDVHAVVGGARSPAESERSNFTSISQRGINPRWEPQPPMPNQGIPPRRPVPAKQQRQDVLLNNNPDFQLPGSRGQAPGRGVPGMIPGSAYPNGAI
ncbi:hypothetical protein E4U42_003693 [Claviceps africana]|uniref:Uncharacterized protein n=1 Tax=Claviceps africana TaxID=83212 RepID=A0A8K0NHL2_9HYPO|nr:hypothetical protein E4U42_003693 [Claviceps africana]